MKLIVHIKLNNLLKESLINNLEYQKNILNNLAVHYLLKRNNQFYIFKQVNQSEMKKC